MSLQAYLERYLPALNRELHAAADRFLPGPPEYDLMLRYHMGWVDEQGNPTHARPGKQIRPTLVLICAESAGGDWQQALPAAAAVEFLHNFSLIHDDIEDNSPLRRGRPTLWKIWGQANAINAGDGMFALAHQELCHLADADIPASRVLAAWELFERTCLILTRGQFLDMTFEQRMDVTIDEYLDMIGGKSAALIAASTQLGALIAGKTPPQIERYAAFGHNLGMAFQVRDDILGIWGDPELTGKSAATDIITRKKSLPVLYGLEHSQEFRAMYAHAYQGDADEVARAVAILDALDARAFVEQYEADYLRRALDAYRSVASAAALAEATVEFVSSLLGRAV